MGFVVTGRKRLLEDNNNILVARLTLKYLSLGGKQTRIANKEKEQLTSDRRDDEPIGRT